MPEKNSRSSIWSPIAGVGGILLVCASMLFPAFNPRIPFLLSLIIGAILGGPCIVLGFRLHPNSSLDKRPDRRFWPTQTEIWGILALLTFFGCLLIPLGLLVFTATLLPIGDDWQTVIICLAIVVVAACSAYWWINFVFRRGPELFRGKISDEALDAFTREEPNDEPKTAKSAALRNWQLPLIAFAACLVTFGIIDFNSPWLDIDVGSRRARKLMRLVTWCRGNPNTVLSSSVLVALGALGLYIYRIGQASTRD